MLVDSTSVRVGGKDDRGREPASVSQDINDQSHGGYGEQRKEDNFCRGEKSHFSLITNFPSFLVIKAIRVLNQWLEK